jgi:hypothetical protein
VQIHTSSVDPKGNGASTKIASAMKRDTTDFSLSGLAPGSEAFNRLPEPDDARRDESRRGACSRDEVFALALATILHWSRLSQRGRHILAAIVETGIVEIQRTGSLQMVSSSVEFIP